MSGIPMRRARASRRRGVIAILAGCVLVASLALAQQTRLPGLRGGQLTDADLASGNWVVVVWASWSPRCRDIVERANALQQRWGNRARVITVDFQEDPAEVEAFLRGKSLGPPVYLDRDGEFAKARAVTSLPGLLVYRDGAVRYQGRLPADASSVIEEALR
jgi:thiol-disulfide isomerase/thioredoxin